MGRSLAGRAKDGLNWALAPLNIEVTRKSQHDWRDVRTFLPFEETLRAVERSGLSVGDYIDTVINKIPGATQATIDQMDGLGVFSGPIDTVVEIGPGSGRYLEKTIAACSPTRYEIYETSGPWADYVAAKYKVLPQATNGESLGSTPTDSVDLVQAHKVFCATSFLATVRYWLECVRVTRRGGYVAFDIVTESCMDPETLRQWAISGVISDSSYPTLIPRSVAVQYFEGQDFSLVGSFFVPLPPGRTETFVFRKLV
jgi:Methyltransferase domain